MLPNLSPSPNHRVFTMTIILCRQYKVRQKKVLIQHNPLFKHLQCIVSSAVISHNFTPEYNGSCELA